jgi:glycerophosphoryl diester phosphodiesterase
MLLLPISNVMAGWGWKSDSNANHYDHSHYHHEKKRKNKQAVQLGPRPYYLINDLEFSHLKHKLKSCESGPFYKTSFSIGHRGAALQFPEHTKESYEAAARMGAGVVECDVTFTSDRELVCRHSQCDLHTTTNILATDLAAKCSVPFTPADPDKGTAATAKCCTSDITLEEFKSLKGKMDAANSAASSVEEYLNATPAWRTDLYTGEATLMTHRESIELFKKLGVKMTPELKSPSVTMPYLGFYTQEDYAQQMIDEYKAADVAPENVYVQSFNLDDVKYWINNESEFGRQAVYLDGRYDLEEFDHRDPSTWSPSMQALVDDGVEIIAPPMWMLLDVDKAGRIVPSLYAKRAKAAGLDIITWTLERSGVLEAEDGTGGGWYYQTLNGANGSMPVIDNDGDTMVVLDVLAKKVEVLGIFSDWPATVSYYANCMGLK